MGRPPWPRALVQTGCALRDGHRLIRLSAGSTFVGRTPCLSQPSHGMQASGVHAVRQLTKFGHGLRERRLDTERACQWDGRITSVGRMNYLNVTLQFKEDLPDPGVHHTWSESLQRVRECHCTTLTCVCVVSRHLRLGPRLAAGCVIHDPTREYTLPGWWRFFMLAPRTQGLSGISQMDKRSKRLLGHHTVAFKGP